MLHCSARVFICPNVTSKRLYCVLCAVFLFSFFLFFCMYPRLLSWKLRCLFVGSWQHEHYLTHCGWRFLKMLPTLCQPSQKLTGGWSGKTHSRWVSNWFSRMSVVWCWRMCWVKSRPVYSLLLYALDYVHVNTMQIGTSICGPGLFNYCSINLFCFILCPENV